jgi:hypothetical protein
MTEQYKIINGNENYSISNLGNIRNDTTGKLLKPSLQSGGQLQVKLTHNKKTTGHYIHRLMAFAFVPLIEGLDMVRHIDLGKSNNTVSNLEWIQDPETIYGHKAYIEIDNVMYNLGFFKSKQEATHAKNINKHITTHEQLLQYRSSNK